MPFLKERINHSFNQTVHISTVHMLYGHNHVDKEIAEETGKSNKGNSDSCQKNQETIAVHLLQSNIQFSYKEVIHIQNSPLFLVNKLPFWFPVQTAPPPDFIV